MLQADHVAYSYTRSTQTLNDVSVQVVPGTFTAVLGMNGCGKSTLMSLLVDLFAPQSGSVTLDGKPISQIPRDERASRIAFVAQHSHANRMSVYDTILLGRKPRMNGAPGKEDIAYVEGILAEFELEGLALRYVDELSGGEYQKVILARAFAQETDILLLDEPTNNLDLANQQEVMRVVRSAVDERGMAAAAVLHDINLALKYCDRFLMIRDGKNYALGGPEVITRESMLDVYGFDADIVEHNGSKFVMPR